MAMVRAAARMAEAELARDAADPARAAAPSRTAASTSCSSRSGRNESLLTHRPTAAGRHARLRLSPRHSEILLLLASAPRGLSGDELAVLLYEDDGASSTLRAELNRLRGLLGDDVLASRPYRLAASVTGDWLAVEAQLAAGDLRRRDARLPRARSSRARRRPGVVRLRDELEALAAPGGAPVRRRRPDVDVDPVLLGARRLRDVGRAARGARRRRRRCWRWSTGRSPASTASSVSDRTAATSVAVPHATSVQRAGS